MLVDENGCDYCGAMPEQPCKTRDGHFTSPHQARWDAYNASLRKPYLTLYSHNPSEIYEVLRKLIQRTWPDASPLNTDVLGFDFDQYTGDIVVTWQEEDMQHRTVDVKKIFAGIDLTSLITEAIRIASECQVR